MQTLLFYCKPFGNAAAIHDILVKSGDYKMEYDLKHINSVDYVLSSHNDPPVIGNNKLIHLAHGLGCVPKLPYSTYEELVEDHKRYYGYCVHSKLEGLWYTGLVQNILNVGMPISIPLLEPVNEQDKHTFLRSRGLDPEKKTVIYMPTWDHGEYRQFFYLWWNDKEEYKRVDTFCKYITQDLDMNLIIRFHESFRYSQNWLELYRDIFNKYDNIYTHYLEQDMQGSLYLVKYSDIFVGDLSNSSTMFLVSDKPVIHIGIDPFRKRRNAGYCGVGINDRNSSGYVTENFDELLFFIKGSVDNPDKFKNKRKEFINKYVDFIGEDSKNAVLREFKRICQN